MSRIFMYGTLYVFLCIAAFSMSVFEFLESSFDAATPAPQLSATTTEQLATPFPVGVFPAAKEIAEQPNVEDFLSRELLAANPAPTQRTWLKKLIAKVTNRGWYQNLASPVSRVVVIYPGVRKEEVSASIAAVLGWDASEKALFENMVTEPLTNLDEGTFFPGYYVFTVDAGPEEVARVIRERFAAEILSRYPGAVASVVPLEDALIIASLLEREAYDFTDMREISGIIWNRLFIDMKLQIDATLQYARGSQAAATAWWPVPVPKDKYIDSPYNTYQNKGLPPGPISNPSIDAVLAALNPVATDCIFYFHDNESRFHCSETYQEHVENLKQHYGRGR